MITSFRKSPPTCSLFPVPSHLPTGFTLLELLLAMAVFAAASTLVIPIAVNLLSDRELVRAGDQIRGELTRLRVHAMREGKVMTLHSDADSGKLRVIPVFSASDSVESSDPLAAPSALLTGAEQAMGVASPTGNSQTSEGWIIELPEGIVVRSVVTSPVGGSSAVEANAITTASAAATTPVNNSGATDDALTAGTLPPVYFYSTGQTSNAIITLGSPTTGPVAGSGDSAGIARDAVVVRVQIRGLTGDVTLRGDP